MSNSHNAEAGGIGLVTVILALVFLFVWPGPFRYQYIRVPGLPPLIRVDRLGGEPYVWEKGQYVPINELDGSGYSTKAGK